MCAYDGWACSIELHASKWKAIDLIKEVFSLKFDHKIKDIIVTQ
jgi:hypothetical protein